MTNYVKVTHPDDNKIFWRQDYETNDQLKRVVGFCKGRKAVNLFAASLYPVRTHNLKDFSKDFFLPTLVNHAIKVRGAVSKIFAIMAALVLDLLTFPIRLVTCIPRILNTPKKTNAPLHQYLGLQGTVNQKLLDTDYVLVEVSYKPASEKYVKHGNFYAKEVLKITTMSTLFIDLPYTSHRKSR